MSFVSKHCAFKPVVLLVLLVGFGVQAVAQVPPVTGTAMPAPAYPETVKRPASDTFTGTAGPKKVDENYRWLETLDDPAVRDWVTLENAVTRRYLDALPSRAAIRDALKELIGNAPVTRGAFRYAGGKLFALKRQPPKNQPMLVVLDANGANVEALDSEQVADERIVLDPNTRNDKGTTAIDWFVPSHDGKLVAVSLSDNGSEKGTLHLFETATGNELSDVVPRVQNPTGGGSVAWNADGTGFWFTRYPAPMERASEDAGFYQQVWFHKLGTRSTFDTPALTELPRIAETSLEASDDGRYVLASVRNGDGGEVGFWLRGPNDQWRRLADFTDGFRRATFGRDGRLYALALKDSPRGRVVAMKLDAPTLARATTIVAQSDAVIEDMTPTASRLYLDVLLGGPSEIRVYTLSGKALPAPAIEPVSTATIGARLAGDAILYGDQSYLTPFAWFLLDPKLNGGKPVRTALSAPPDALSTDGFVVTRVMARSKDGTDVPVNIVAKKGVSLDGSNPTLLTAYGGYGVSVQPRYSRRTLFWLLHGGVFAVANIRGGGEFGEQWHLAGNLTRKQNVFDDFAAAAHLLIDRGYTRPKKLAIEGGSNGGLLMGAELVQHPDLYGAVVSHVGIYDMLRVELTPNGAFNVTEFGTVKDPAQFDALYAYSPYHHVVDGVAYPPILMTTGINDGRVDAWQSMKMAARLQAANPKDVTLLRVAGDAGHGQGMSLSSAIELDADTFAFLFHSLGMDSAALQPIALSPAPASASASESAVK
jgi:prolyl oligopeptidase